MYAYFNIHNYYTIVQNISYHLIYMLSSAKTMSNTDNVHMRIGSMKNVYEVCLTCPGPSLHFLVFLQVSTQMSKLVHLSCAPKRPCVGLFTHFHEGSSSLDASYHRQTPRGSESIIPFSS